MSWSQEFNNVKHNLYKQYAIGLHNHSPTNMAILKAKVILTNNIGLQYRVLVSIIQQCETQSLKAI